MSRKPTNRKKVDKPAAEVEDAEVVAEEPSKLAEDTADAAAPEKPKDIAEDAPEDDAEPEDIEARDDEIAREIDRVADDPEAETESAVDDPDHVETYPDVEEEPAHEDEDGGRDHADEFHDEHERPRTMAGYALSGLIIFLVGAAIALWAAPRVAPHLPASMAKYLETGSTVSADDLATLRAAIDGRMRALESKTLSVSTVTELVDARLGETRKTLEARVDGLADKIAAADSAAIAARLSAVETTLAGLESRFAALSDGLTNINTGGAGLTPEDAARIAGFSAAVEGLRAEIGNLSQKSGALSQRIDDVAAAAARRVEAAETTAESVKAEAETAIKGMALSSALDELQISVFSGAPYAEALARLGDATEATPPEALAAAAATGVPTLSALRAAFPDAAHDAIAAAVEADAGAGFTEQASAWFKAQFTGLPVGETAGEDAPAILSRVAARLAEGDLGAALAEADALPEAAAEAFAPWKTSAERRRAALAALASWRGELGANG